MSRWAALALGLILLVAVALRVPSHNWDADGHFHPDERYVTRVTIDRVQLPPGVSLSVLLDPQRSPINPRVGGLSYTYGALPLYLGKAATVVAFSLTGDPYFNSYNGTQQTGRVVAGLADTLTVVLVFLLGLRLWGRRSGLSSGPYDLSPEPSPKGRGESIRIETAAFRSGSEPGGSVPLAAMLAAALYALALLPIQIAHFYISEPFMTLATTATALCSLIYCQGGRRRWLLLAGLAAGLAVACKLSAAPVLVLPVAAVLLRGWRAGMRTSPAAPGSLVADLVLVGLMALAGLALGDPFALLDAPTYLAQVAEQAAIQSGATDVPFTRQYVGTWPVLYPLGQLLMLGAGPVAGVAAVAGLPTAWRARRARQGVDFSSNPSPEGGRDIQPAGHGHGALLLLLGSLAYFLSIAFLEAKWLRYLLPLVPYLCLAAAAPLAGWTGAGRRGTTLAGLLLVGSVLSALAFSAIYTAAPTRLLASEWIYQTLPAGTRLGVEVGDDFLPRRLAGYPAPETAVTQVPFDMLADHPPAEASTLLRAHLASVDYLVLGSTRLAYTVRRLPWRYPVQNRYYDALFAGDLGFTPVYTATAYPSIFGLAIPDDVPWLDRTFTEYDHPPVRIFARRYMVSEAQWGTLFADATRRPFAPTRQAP